MEFGGRRCVEFAIVFFVVFGNGHRPSVEQGDKRDECAEENQRKCCPGPVRKDEPSKVEGCESCVCKAIDYEWRKTESFVKWYTEVGYPVDPAHGPPYETGHEPDYSRYIQRHIDPRWKAEAHKEKGIKLQPGALRDVADLPAIAKLKPGSQFEDWYRKFNPENESLENVPVHKLFEDAKKVLTNEGPEAEHFKVDGIGVPVITHREDDPREEEVSDAFKGAWREKIQALGVQAFNMRMMAEEELLALRDFLLKECVDCDEKIKAARKKLQENIQEWEKKRKSIHGERVGPHEDEVRS
jgi:hypothetical protein